MSHLNDREYFADRAEQEVEVGDRAASPLIAAIHYELAFRYSLLSHHGRLDFQPWMVGRA